jgi:uncharacterized membrane protein
MVERNPEPSLVSYTHVMYALHGLAAAIGIFGSATIIGQFVFGLPSIVAVIMNYARRSEARGTWLESHFSWQLTTFWSAVLWGVVVIGVSYADRDRLPDAADRDHPHRVVDHLPGAARLAGPEGRATGALTSFRGPSARGPGRCRRRSRVPCRGHC